MIKPAQAQNLNTLAALAKELWSEHELSELACEYEGFIANPEAQCFIYYVDDKPAAFAHCQLRHDYVEGTSSSPVGYLEGIYVKAEYRRRGIAGQLLKACEDWSRERGCTEFASDCVLDNIDSLRFHMSMGFSEAIRIICFQKEL